MVQSAVNAAETLIDLQWRTAARLCLIAAIQVGTPLNRVIMQAEQLKDTVVDALEGVKAKDISIIDVRDRTSVTDFMVIASGTSNRHVKSLADSVVVEAKSKGVRTATVEGGQVSDWLLVDLGDVVVHVMMPATREFYDLERLWRDAPGLGAAGSE